MAYRKRSKGYRKSRSTRRYRGNGGGVRSQRVVVEVRHSAAPSGVGNVFATGNPAQPFAANPPPATPGKGKF